MLKISSRYILAVLLLCAGMICASVSTVLAASIVVGGSCSLHDAIEAANLDRVAGGCPAGNGADTISLTSSLVLSGELPEITSEIKIAGGDYGISGNGAFRIFLVEETGNLSLDRVKLNNGRGFKGGAVRIEDGVLSISNSVVSNNSSFKDGGAIFNLSGTLNIRNSSFSHNQSGSDGGAIKNFGSTTTSISGSTFSNNTSEDDGGAIEYRGGSHTISGSSFIQNSTTHHGDGGAIYSVFDSLTISNSNFILNSSWHNGGAIASSGQLTITGSTFGENRSRRDGGGIQLRSSGSREPVSISNSTIVRNVAGENGGGIHKQQKGVVTLKHVTIAGNSAASGGGLYRRGSVGSVLNVVNSIVAGSASGGDCVSNLNQNIGNLIQDGSCSPSRSGDPRLGLLTGQPPHFPLQNDSPAVNAADSRYCTSRDQAGNSRPFPSGGNCDIGAFELQVAVVLTAVNPAPTDTPAPTNTPVPTDPPLPTNTPVPTNTLAPTETPVPTDPPAPSEFCVRVGPGAYWLFPPERFLSGRIEVYTGVTCDDTEVTAASIGANGYVYTNGSQNSAASLCAAGHNNRSVWIAAQQAFNTDVWQCSLLAADSPSPTPTPTDRPTPTETPAPASAPQGESELLAVIDAKIIRHRDVTGRSDLVAGFEAARAGLTGEISASDALALINPDWGGELWQRIRSILTSKTNPGSNPTNTPLPTSTPVTPTSTPLPTNTPVTPTSTPLPTNTPVTPTSTPLPTNTPVTPTNTPVPTNTPAPTNTPQLAQVDTALLATIDEKIVRHRDVTGRTDLITVFTAARDALTGNGSVDAALSLSEPFTNELWGRIRAALNAMKS